MDQAALWNSSSGQAWVDAEGLIDETYKPVEVLLVDEVTAALASGARVRDKGPHVLDVGCGTGATTLAVARRLGANASVVGIDVSEPMIAAAVARAERERTPARFVKADAQRHAFEPASFDGIVSRFGVMFFDDPVAAFANLRRAAREGAVLRLVAWRGADENPFMTTAERAAATVLPDMPVRDPDAPGQFAFASERRVRRILEESGWSGIDMRSVDLTCAFPERDLVGYVTRFGPLGRLLPDVDRQTRERVIDAVRPAFAPYIHEGEVRFTAACWLIAA